MVMMSSVTLNNDVDRGSEEGNKEEETKRDWGEERHSDVIYKVILKKKVVRSPSPTNNNEPSDGLLYATHKVRYIKGAKLPLIVARLCQSFLVKDEWSETNFHTVFFATYRTYTTATEVLDAITKEAEKLKTESPEKKVATMRSLIQVLRTWLERYFKEDFYNPPHHHLLKRLRNLAEEFKQDEDLSEIFTSFDGECDFFTFTNSMVQQAEVKGLQEEACENMNTPSIFSDILDETDDVCVEEHSVNMEAARTFLNLLSSQQIAEQLTVKAANLFLRLVPHHCLDAVRSRDKPATVKATIEQFNKVTYCVQGTCLCPGLKASTRAKVISKWIEVAQACLELKNFSSFHAVISGLQTYAIHRLKQTWQQVSSTHINLLEEMRRINIKTALMTVGMSKGLPEKSLTMKVRKDMSVRRHQTMPTSALHGTVPYLGTFLTDLTYLHTANPDYLEKSLINFNKMRKEFEMLAQLQLWQASCRSYQQLESDQRFSDWFNSVTLPSDDQAIQLSEEIEPVSTINLPSISPAPVKKALSEMLASQISDVSGIPPTSFHPGHRQNLSSDTTQAKDVGVCLGESDSSAPRTNGHAVSETPSDHEQRLVKVKIITKLSVELAEQPAVKEMELCSNDRSPAFMKKAFSLFEFDNEDIKNFSLVQFLPDDKELLIPDSGNVFYAMNSSTKDYNFALIECGTELAREKQHKAASLSLNVKGKKTRKTASVSSMSAVSPMKKFLGRSKGSGFYSPFRELQRQESSQERRESLKSMSPELNHRKVSADDSIASSNTNSNISSDDSGGESDSSGLQRFRKFIGKGKGHRRNLSDSGHLNNYRTSDAVLSPFKMVQPIILPVGASRAISHASDSENEADLGESSSSKGSRGTPTLKGQFRSTPSRNKSEPIRNSAKVFQKQESRSTFYVTFPADVTPNQSCSSFESSHSTESKNSAPEKEGSFLQPPNRPNALDLSLGENEVFGDIIQTPVITVQSPSPQRSSEWFASNQNTPDANDVATNRRRCASETLTTAL